VTSEFDRVFPAKNLKGYWGKVEGTKHIILPLPHYIFGNWKSYTDFIQFVLDYKKKPGIRKKGN
jgi:hypothetical protein